MPVTRFWPPRGAWEILLLEVALLIGATCGIGPAFVIFPPHVGRLQVALWLLGTILVLGLLIPGALACYRTACKDERRRHAILKYCYVYLAAFMAGLASILAIVGYLALQEHAVGPGLISWSVAIVCVLLLWPTIRKLLKIARQGTKFENYS